MTNMKKSLEEQSERMQKFNSEQIALHEKNKTEEDLNGSVSRMIKEIIKKWDTNKHLLQRHLEKNTGFYRDCDYEDILKSVIRHVLENEYENITEVDDGHYQGTLIFLFHEKTYQPNEQDYIVTRVSYGSCSYCDTLQAAQYGDDKHFVSNIMTLALHLVQNMKYLYTREDYEGE